MDIPFLRNMSSLNQIVAPDLVPTETVSSAVSSAAEGINAAKGAAGLASVDSFDPQFFGTLWGSADTALAFAEPGAAALPEKFLQQLCDDPAVDKAYMVSMPEVLKHVQDSGFSISDALSSFANLNIVDSLTGKGGSAGIVAPDLLAGIVAPTDLDGLNQPAGLDGLNQPAGLDGLNQPASLNEIVTPSMNSPAGLDGLNQPAAIIGPGYLDGLNQPAGLDGLNQPANLNGIVTPSMNQPAGLDGLNQPALAEPLLLYKMPVTPGQQGTGQPADPNGIVTPSMNSPAGLDGLNQPAGLDGLNQPAGLDGLNQPAVNTAQFEINTARPDRAAGQDRHNRTGRGHGNSDNQSAGSDVPDQPASLGPLQVDISDVMAFFGQIGSSTTESENREIIQSFRDCLSTLDIMHEMVKGLVEMNQSASSRPRQLTEQGAR